MYHEAISGFETPPFGKARQRQIFDPFGRQIREKVGKNDLKMYDSEVSEVSETCIFKG